MARVYTGEPRPPDAASLGPLERADLPAAAHGPARAGRTGRPTRARLLVFSALFFVALYLILRTQGVHPFNPEDFDSGTWDVSFNTAASFVTNTNWQYYGGETTLSYFSQMAGLAVQNFVSAAVGMAVLVAVIRGFAARGGQRARQLLARPDRARCSTSCCRSRSSARWCSSRRASSRRSRLRRLHDAHGRRADARARAGRLAGDHQGARHQRRRLLQRQLGDAVREPDGLSNFVEMLLILLIPAGADRDLRAHGRQPPPGLGAVRGDARSCSSPASRSSTPPRPHGTPGAARAPGSTGGNLEGKEQRFGDRRTRALWTAVTTVASAARSTPRSTR